MTKRVLHIFPDSVLDPRQRHLGSTKDIRGRTQYFAERSLMVDELSHERSAVGLNNAIARTDARPYDAVFVEFPLSVRSLSTLRKANTDAMLMTRSENAEILHRWDWIRAMGPSVAAAKLTVRAGLNAAAEVAAGHHSDAVLAISDWEAEHYWPRMMSRKKIRWLPYYLPDDYLSEMSAAEGQRKELCVCLTSTIENPLIEQSVRAFEHAVAGLRDTGEWRFVVTGKVGDDVGLGSGRVKHTGLLDSPMELLATSRAVALLSDYGYGFKTKLLEAIIAGNRVLVTPGLYRRMPRILDPWTLCVDLRDPASFAEALDEARDPLPQGDPNTALREQHHAVLDALILGHVGPAP